MRLFPLLLAAACTAPTPPDVSAVFAPRDGFFGTPFPSDARRTADGTPDWSGFPNPADNAILADFLDRADDRPGFGLNGPVWVRFDGPVDPDALPDAFASVEPGASVQIVDVTPDSPTFGERVPLRFDRWDVPGAYVPEHTLAVAPVPGWPLRPATTYALVVTTDVAQRPAAFDDALAGDGPWSEVGALLDAALPRVDVPRDRVAIASTFTTGDPVAELAGIARFVRERVEPPTFSPNLEFRYDLGDYRVHRSNYTTPQLMSGDKPYAQEGGAFAFRGDGLPEVQEWDRMRLSVVTPQEGRPPPGGWPVLVYLHGTGGDYRTYCNSDAELEVATWLTRMGAVGLGIDLPLHGPRGTPDTTINLHSFNFLQPDSALHIHRQAAVDLLHLVEGLTAGPVTFEAPDGTEVPLDPNRIVVMGHSQGGLTASLAMPFLGDRVDGVMLSGAGGLLAITIAERDDILDFNSLIRTLLEFEEDEPLTDLHPVLGLIQQLVDRTDPINYAPYWFHEDRGFPGQSPLPVLLTTGLGDQQTPTKTAEALAAAARLPFAGRRVTNTPAMALRGFDTARLPLTDNVEAWDGSRLTGGFSQWPDGDHFVVFQDEVASEITRNFVGSVFEGDAAIRKGEAPSLVE